MATAELAGLPLPRGTTLQQLATESLELQAGIGGAAAATFVYLLDQLGVEARTVHIEYDGGGHAAAEMRWGARWHFFDPTRGTFYDRRGEVLSLGDVLGLRQPARFAVTNQTLLWRQVTRSASAARSTGRAFLSEARLRVNDVNGRELYRRG